MFCSNDSSGSHIDSFAANLAEPPAEYAQYGVLKLPHLSLFTHVPLNPATHDLYWYLIGNLKLVTCDLKLLIGNLGGSTPFAKIAADTAEKPPEMAQNCHLKLPPMLPILPITRLTIPT